MKTLSKNDTAYNAFVFTNGSKKEVWLRNVLYCRTTDEKVLNTAIFNLKTQGIRVKSFLPAC